MPVKVPKKQRKLGLLPECRMANNGFHGSYSWHVSQVAATKACLTVLQMLHQWTAKWDCIIGYRVTGWINGINAFILFFGYTFYRR
jgi:hypothetical protein